MVNFLGEHGRICAETETPIIVCSDQSRMKLFVTEYLAETGIPFTTCDTLLEYLSRVALDRVDIGGRHCVTSLSQAAMTVYRLL